MQKNNLKVVFEKFLNGQASQDELEILMNSFQEEEETTLPLLIYKEFEKQESKDVSNKYPQITNRVRKALLTKRMEELYAAYVDQRITKNELLELYGYLASDEVDMDQFPLLNDTPLLSLPRLKGYKRSRIKSQKNKGTRFGNPKRISLVASIIMLFIAMIWIFPYDTAELANIHTEKFDITLPLSNQATIIFEDGSIMNLLHSDKKELYDRGIEIIELGNGQILFQIHEHQQLHPGRQTFYSPKGTTAQLILVDGTKVWLNSNTQLNYPTHFSESERRISIHGEAYFEVHHNPDQPFIVEAEGTEVKVLGTDFNIATNVKDNAVLTTLVHGSVEVATNQQKLKITPGMQSSAHKNNGSIHTVNADLSKELAWKSGLFLFDEDDIYAVLDKLKVWYNISGYEVKELTSDRFSGAIKRTRKLSQLLTNLEKISNYKFKIMDRRIIVMK